MPSAGRSYVLKTDRAPIGTYRLCSRHTLRAAQAMSDMLDDFPENVSTDILTMALSFVDFEHSFGIYGDLVPFHSFINDRPASRIESARPGHSPTYVFAETASEVLVEHSRLTFLKRNERSDLLVDFDCFPVTECVSEVGEPINVSVNYGRAFETFTQLKYQKESRRLYNQICLWVFARNFERVNRIYSNAYIPISFYVAILNSAIGRPEQCSAVLHCPACGRDIEHETETWGKYFRRHFGNEIGNQLDIRSKTFHEAAFLDFWEEWDRIGALGAEEAQRETEKLERMTFATEQLCWTVRARLLTAFLERYLTAARRA